MFAGTSTGSIMTGLLTVPDVEYNKAHPNGEMGVFWEYAVGGELDARASLRMLLTVRFAALAQLPLALPAAL